MSDKWSFCAAVNKNGKKHKHQIMELINSCRNFSIDPQSPQQVVRLRSVLEACDLAIEHVFDSREDKLSHAELAIEDAARKLHEYEWDFYEKRTVKTRMDNAKEEDEKENENKRQRYRKRDRTKDIINPKHPLRLVCFKILRSLHDTNPTTVEQWLDGTLGLPFILWYFGSRKPEKRLTLAQNPQFYDAFPTRCGPACQIWPAVTPENYQDKVYILTNNERRVVLEFGQNWRSFDNVWRTSDNTLILKDVIGIIEGEAVVEESIHGRLRVSQRPCETHPDFELEEVEDKKSWKTPIHNLLDSQRTHIHISINDQ